MRAPRAAAAGRRGSARAALQCGAALRHASTSALRRRPDSRPTHARAAAASDSAVTASVMATNR